MYKNENLQKLEITRRLMLLFHDIFNEYFWSKGRSLVGEEGF